MNVEGTTVGLPRLEVSSPSQARHDGAGAMALGFLVVCCQVGCGKRMINS